MPIKILHLSDVHLGMENYGTVNPKTGLNSRLDDFLRCFDYTVDYAISNHINLVVFSGDAFKTRDPSQTYQREFAKRVYKIASNDIPVVLLVGNHDLPNAAGKAHTLDIYSTLEIDNVYVSDRPEVLEIEIENHENSSIQVATLPWLSKSSFLTDENLKGKSIEEINRIMSEKVIAILKDLEDQLDPTIPAILVAHATVAGAEFGSERRVWIGNDVVVPLNLLAKEPWKYVALGHLHKYQVLSEEPPVIYAGSIDRIDFGEEKEDKGFVVAEIESDKDDEIDDFELSSESKKQKGTTFEFISTPARKFVTIDVDIREDDKNPQKTVLDKIKNGDSIKNSVVRVNIVIPESKKDFIDDKEIKKNLESAYYIAGISKEIVKTERECNEINLIEEMSVIDILEKYFKIKKFPEKRMKSLKEEAEKLVGKIKEN